MVRWRVGVLALFLTLCGPVGIAAGRSTITLAQPSAVRLVVQATLSASSASGRLGFIDPAISGPTVVGMGVRFSDPSPFSNARVLVFARRGGAWADETPAADLVPTSGPPNGAIAISGKEIFVAGNAADGSAVVYVFTEPPGGWSGTLAPAARLTISGPVTNSGLSVSVAASGSTVVAGAGGSAYVFSEPSAGWSGTVHQSSTLSASDGSVLGEVGMSGRTIVAAGIDPNQLGNPFQSSVRNAGYVFHEPAGGWSGVLTQAAKLGAPGNAQLTSLGMSGSTVVIGSGPDASDGDVLSIFIQPAGGWSGFPRPQAVRAIEVPYDAGGLGVAISGANIAATATNPVSHQCGCITSLYAFNQGLGSWSQSPSIPPDGITTGGGGIALDGESLVSGTGYGVRVHQTLVPSSLSRVAVTGLQGASPRFQFKVNAGRGAPPVKSVTLRLPPGLRFAQTANLIAHGLIAPTGTKHHLAHGKLVLTFKHAAASFPITIAAPALTETARLRARLARLTKFNRTHTRKRAFDLIIAVAAADSADHATSITITDTLR